MHDTILFLRLHVHSFANWPRREQSKSMKTSMTSAPSQSPLSTTRRRDSEWTLDEHERYLEALVRFPHGPWKARAAFIGTRTTRQTMTHAQKIALRLKRHARGLKKAGRPRRGSTTSQEAEDYEVPIKTEIKAEEPLLILEPWTPPSPVSPSHTTLWTWMDVNSELELYEEEVFEWDTSAFI